MCRHEHSSLDSFPQHGLHFGAGSLFVSWSSPQDDTKNL